MCDTVSPYESSSRGSVSMIPMVVSGVFTSAKSAYPQVVLKQLDGSAYLPIVIGRFEAAAISMAQTDRRPARPISYDLAQTVLKSVGAAVVRVQITSLRDGTYYAEVHVRDADGTILVVDSRPSDAIALALRMDAPIFAAASVLKEAGYVRPEGEEAQLVGGSVDDADDVGLTEPLIRAVVEPAPPPAPEQLVARMDPVDALRKRLEQAVAEEVYEEAARLRDEIARLEQEAKG